ncbi:MAG: GNAT family N-acetyltransferase [Chloroflexota bacterium]
MKLNMQSYKNDDDYWRMRQFLRQMMLRNGRREFSWHVARLDYWWWFINKSIEKIKLEENVFIWETDSAQIAAILNPEGRGQAFLQIDPDLASPALLEEMVSVAEEYLPILARDGKRKLQIFSDARDKILQEILARHSFQRVERPEESEFQHRCNLDDQLPPLPDTPGYTIRALGNGLEFLERCYASGLGFHEDDINIARDNRDHPEWYRQIQMAPLYRRDLDIIAVAADGSIGSFCTMWFDDVSLTAYIEPVATVPAHRQKGLGKATILFGLQRLQRMGCKVAFVGGYSTPANALYFSVMGPEYDISEPWEKIYQSSSQP